jgi:transposase
MLKRNDKVYTQIVKNCSASELISIIKKADSHSTMDSLSSDIKRRYRIKHESNEFAESQFSQQDGNHVKIRNHINGIENFWVLAKIKLARFRGIHKSISNFTSKNVNFDSIIERKIFTKLC